MTLLLVFLLGITVCCKAALCPKHLLWLPEHSRSSSSNQCSKHWVQLRSSYTGSPLSAQLSSDLRLAEVTVTENKSRVNQLLVWADINYSFCLYWGPVLQSELGPHHGHQGPCQEVQGAGEHPTRPLCSAAPPSCFS